MKKDMIEQILYWKKKRKALILAHNYQIPEIQDLADYVGDSLELSQKAAKTSAKLIVFCGVHFMAETASILCPKKTVLIPDPNAGCSLANKIDVKKLKEWKKKYPKAVVVSYVNTTAQVKALSDYCCTSSNAVNIVNSIPKNKSVLLVPDMFLAQYVAKLTKRDNLIIFPGECHVHARVTLDDIKKKMSKIRNAEFLIHPECGCSASCMFYKASGDLNNIKTHILSTGGMIKHAKQSPSKNFVVATEEGILHRLKKENPNKNFYPVRDDMICKYMKMITLDKLLDSLKNLTYEVKVPEKIANRARKPIQKMVEIS